MAASLPRNPYETQRSAAPVASPRPTNNPRPPASPLLAPVVPSNFRIPTTLNITFGGIDDIDDIFKEALGRLPPLLANGIEGFRECKEGKGIIKVYLK